MAEPDDDEVIEGEDEELTPEEWQQLKDELGLKFVGGQFVEIVNLGAAPQYNGKRALIVDYDEEMGAYIVEIDGAADVSALREANM